LIARRDSLKMNSTEKEGVKENLTNTTDADAQPAKLSPTQGETEGKTEGKTEGDKKDGGGNSEALVRESYLPANKLKDTPSASHYEGVDPEKFMQTKKPSVLGNIKEIVEKAVHKK